MKNIGAIALLCAGLLHGQVSTTRVPVNSYSFQGATLGMSLSAFKTLKDVGPIQMDFMERTAKGKYKSVKRDVPTPICSDTIGGADSFAATSLQPGEIACDVQYGNPNRDDLVVAGQPVTQILFKFFNQKLETIEVRFPSVSYLVISSAFREKYGNPTTETTTDNENAMGATWSSDYLEWRQGSQSIRMFEGSGNGPGQDSFGIEGSSSVTISDSSLTPTPAPKRAVDF